MPPAPPPRPLRILCAEDDPVIAQAVKRALETAGCVVDLVGDGAQALERLSADVRYYDVLVTDHEMAEFSGLGLVAKLRDTGFVGQILVFSAQLTEADREVYRALAVDRIFDKPAGFKELIETIRTLGAHLG